MAPTTEQEAKAYVEKLTEYESQGFDVVRLRTAREHMLEDLKKAALAIDIKNFSNSIWPSQLDKTPLRQLMQYFYNDICSVEEWAKAQLKGCRMTIESHNKYINGISKKHRLSISDKETIKFWEKAIQQQQNDIERIKNALMARKKKATPVVKEEPKKLSREEMLREDIINSVREHGDLIKGILEDYLVTDGAELEIAQALTNLVIAVKMIKVEEEEKKELTAKEVIELAKDLYENDDLSSDDLLQFMVEDEVAEFVKGKNFAFVKVDTMEKRTKLQEFAETQLWPAYNDQRENILI